jgi:molybdenum cofactor cytidylyltransferase
MQPIAFLGCLFATVNAIIAAMNVKTPKCRSPRIFGIVPAAGRSERMGRPKQLLQINGRPMIQAVIEPLADSSLDGILLVTHSDIADKISGLALPRTQVALNDDQSSQMIDSIRIGLTFWAEREKILPDDGLLVCPGDLPGLTRDDIDICLAHFREHPQSIVIATHRGKHGHPIILPASMEAFVRSRECDQGLRALPQHHGEQVKSVECSAAVLRNVNTPEDYKELQ